MLTRPPATNRQVLAGTAVLTGLMSLSFATDNHIELATCLLLVVATSFLMLAAWRPFAALVFAGFGVCTVAFATRALLGQLAHGLDWQQRLRLLTVWTLLAVGTWRRAEQARRIIRDGST